MTEGSLNLNNFISSKTERILAATGLGIFAIGCFVVAFFNPSTEKFFPACPILATTGFACSGCGLTRGFHALFHGDILTAMSYNALIPIYVIAFTYFIIHLFLVTVRGRGLGLKLFNPWTLVGFFVIALLFGFIRNIPYHPFSVLFP